MRYALLLNNLEAQDADISEEDMEPFKVAFDEYGRALEAAGVLIAAEILQPVADTTQVTLRNGGLTIQDGPFIDTKERLAGAFVIDVPDLDAALAWAEKCPGAQYGVIEVRPSAISFTGGRWVMAG
ncbi:YciI family protein [Planctomonas sp. JC2975]|uniref:YciI family protein n=1 Tax=Planctomonas sp. JC2975 TaxID=2729626 RepID=UPI0014738DD4|nr:YciI family protein [Planctomonas sp. JC2975]NNC12987.1 YciI family protein [Planctomonas sp. JC2975]